MEADADYSSDSDDADYVQSDVSDDSVEEEGSDQEHIGQNEDVHGEDGGNKKACVAPESDAEQRRIDALWESFSKKDRSVAECKVSSLSDSGSREPEKETSELPDDESAPASTSLGKPGTSTEKEECCSDVKSDSSTSQKRPELITSEQAKPPCGVKKRPGGMLSALDAIGKKQKISTLEKSRLDWGSFKQASRIDEELSQHNRGKHGFLDRREFLERTDFRQFERERDVREAMRKKM